MFIVTPVVKCSSVGPCDVTKKEDPESLVARISRKEKYINLLITNAGISGPKAEPESEKASELKERLFNGESFSGWSDTFNTNVSAVYASQQVSLIFWSTADLTSSQLFHSFPCYKQEKKVTATSPPP
jgi:NAD(P)-dependent dehydrogenase (short-subunit alcohol dehydrogenase family)